MITEPWQKRRESSVLMIQQSKWKAVWKDLTELNEAKIERELPGLT